MPQKKNSKNRDGCIMNETEIKMLKILCRTERIQKSRLQEKVGVKDWQFGTILRKLKRLDLLMYDSLYVQLEDTPKAISLYNSSLKYDLAKLLRNANDVVLTHMEKGKTMKEIIDDSGLSRATVYRAIADFSELGIVRRIVTFKLDADLHSLSILLTKDNEQTCKIFK